MPEKNDPENGQEYDLKASTRKIGQLYPVLRAADGEILDGKQRIESDSSWKTLTLENINTPEKKIIAKLVANSHRRTVATQEKAYWINQLAEIYRNNGLKTEGSRNNAQGPNEIVQRICEATGIGWRTVLTHLDSSFKQQSHRRLDPEQHPSQAEPETIIYNHLRYNPQWARQVIERFKQEHEKQLLESPLFRKKMLDSIPRSDPTRPAIAFEPMKNEQIQELLKLKEEDIIPNHFFRNMSSRAKLETREERNVRIKKEAKEGWESLPSLYETFMEECPNCICSSCPHAEECIERVRPEGVDIRPLFLSQALRSS